MSGPLPVAWVSLGCPKNLVDSECMLGALAERGLLVGAPMEEAEVIVINTCSFIAAARDEARAVIAEAVALRDAGQARRVVVTGCMPTHRGATLRTELGVDAVIGVDARDAIVDAVLGSGPLERLGRPDAPPPPDAGRFRLTPRHTAYLRIAEGCSQKCTYCTIPAIRGPYRSKPPEAVLDEARELIADGARELNIIAQDTTAYGSDTGGTTLAGLLRRLDALDDAAWIRVLYTYPRRFTDELIDAIAECPRVLPYVDLPLQHVADGVLKRMGRGVTYEQIERLLDALRRRVDRVALRTTFIVGFPGETEADFAQLLEFVRRREFENLGVFEYSPEPGTPAAKLPDRVPDAVKAPRAERVMLAQQEIAFAANRQRIGQELTVLVDGPDAEGRTLARTQFQAPDIDGVCILTNPAEPGTMLRVTVTDAAGYDLVVRPVT